MTDLVAAIQAAIDETAAWARAASQTNAPGTPTGEHWHWECSECDTPITIDPVTDSYVECSNGCSGTVALRSVEKYPTSVGPLSTHVLSYCEEVPALTGAHIARHDPAAVLRRCAADRKILDLHAPGVTLTSVTDGGTVTTCMSCGGWYTMKTGTEWPCDTIKALAEAYGVED